MRKLTALILVLLATWSAQAQTNIATGAWRIHLPYYSVTGIAESEKFIYVTSSVGLYRYDKKSGEVEILSKVNGFSDVQVAVIGVSPENEVFIGYDNTNIDILKNGIVSNISDIFRKQIVGVKQINDVTFIDRRAYVSCSFGIVVIDLNRMEVIDSYLNIGPNGSVLNILGFQQQDDLYYAATPEGIYTAAVTGVNLSDFNNWSLTYPFNSSNYLTQHEGALYVVADNRLRRLENGSWLEVDSDGVDYDFRHVGSYHDRLIASRSDAIMVYQGTDTRVINARETRYAIMDEENSVWTGGFFTGLIKVDQAGQFSYLTPNGPFKSSIYELRGHKNEIWGTSGGFSQTWAPVFENGGYYHYKDAKWRNLDRSIVALDTMYDFTAIEIDQASGEVWLGTHGVGIVRMNPDGTYKDKFTSENSTLNPGAGSFTMCLGLGLDEERNLWVANYLGDPAVSVRKPNGDWIGFDVPENQLGEMVIDRFNQKWMVIPRDETKGIYVMQEVDLENGTFIGRTLSDQSGQGGLPSNTVNALALDADGEVWVGTDQGIAIFTNPFVIFDPDADNDAFRPTIDDGQDIGYLLGTQVVNDIKVDPANRKWVATNNGAWLVSANGQEVLLHFTSENSPLLTNQVRCVGINGVTGEVFFGTSKGIISYRGDATKGDDTHGEVVVFPNPVKETYEGLITITGLPDNAGVKITDIAGRVVYETLANGGTATWDGRSFDGRKPQTGVYLVFSTNRDGEDAVVSKFLLVH
jgi:ligand-binding sensor domain-containing protein